MIKIKVSLNEVVGWLVTRRHARRAAWTLGTLGYEKASAASADLFNIYIQGRD